jgi:type II secretory pathway pseudopilin PulG
MIVVLIIAIIATVAVLALGRYMQKQSLGQSYNNLQVALSNASHRALIDGQVIGVRFSPHRYDFYVYQPGHPAHWRLVDDAALPSHQASSSVTFQVSESVLKKALGMDALFLATVTATPLRIHLHEGEHGDQCMLLTEAAKVIPYAC